MEGKTEHGLSNSDARALLTLHGYNELLSAKPKTIWKIALEVVQEPMFILLLSAGFLYLLLGDYSEGIIMLCWILIIIYITFYQYRKTERSLDALKQLSSPRAMVIRNGIEIRIAGREVVPGDIMILNEGDRVPADALLIQGTNLIVNESLLTGESVPVRKYCEELGNKLYSGTLVVQGRGVAKVLTTGRGTQFGKIGSSLDAIEKGKTHLQVEMKVLIRRLFIAGGLFSVGVIIAFYITRGNFLASLLNGLAASMALLPEEFPVVLTIFLALGAWRLSKQQILTRTPSAIETLGSASVLCSDKTGTITQNKMKVVATSSQTDREPYLAGNLDNRELIISLHFASPTNSIDPMEKAIACEFETLDEKPDYNLIKEFPFQKDRPVITRILRSESDGKMMAFCKGAPETVFKLCRLTEKESEKHLEILSQFAKKGLRVLAASQYEFKGKDGPKSPEEIPFSFKGLVGFEDPVREEVPTAIEECKAAGIRVIMITGDYPLTASSIAAQIGLPNSEQVLTGDELNKMSDSELQEQIKDTHVFARIIPEQKMRIVQALKANGEIVAMTGDGVNDAPALKAAHIGVAMGLKGTDVAREASSLVLLDDNFASIVQAIRLGRRIFDNLQKAMSYIIAIHIPIIGLVLLPAFFPGLPILLMPLHIVFMEMIIDPSCSIAFESEQEEIGIMSRPPRSMNDKFFGWGSMTYSVLKGLLLLAMVISVYFLSLNEGHTFSEVRTIAFSALIIGNVLLIFHSLSTTRSVLHVLRSRNKAIGVIALFAMLILAAIIRIPFLQNIFSFQYPGHAHLLTALISSFAMLLLLEISKKRRSLSEPTLHKESTSSD